MVTEVLGGGKFYVQPADQKVVSIQQQLASLTLQEAPLIGAFNPKKGDLVLAQFSADNSWNRAMVRVTSLHHTSYFFFFPLPACTVQNFYLCYFYDGFLKFSCHPILEDCKCSSWCCRISKRQI